MDTKTKKKQQEEKEEEEDDENGVIIESLPVEIKTEILIRLPIKTIGTLKSVSKHLNSLITSPYFTQSHRRSLPLPFLRHHLLLSSPIPYPSIDFLFSLHFSPHNSRPINSCHGLVLLLHHPSSSLSLLNPTTKQHFTLPLQPDPISLIGFGYDGVTDDYKAVVVVVVAGSSSFAKIYSVKTGSWRVLDCGVGFRVDPDSKPGYVNGVVHWLSADKEVIGFDFAEEGFKVVSLPENVEADNVKCVGVLGGDLCIFSRKNGGGLWLEMWAMAKYGVVESWVKILMMPSGNMVQNFNNDYRVFEVLRPVCYLRDKILMQVEWGKLVLYSPKERKFEDFGVDGRRVMGCEVVEFEEGIVSLDGYIGENGRVEENDGE